VANGEGGEFIRCNCNRIDITFIHHPLLAKIEGAAMPTTNGRPMKMGEKTRLHQAIYAKNSGPDVLTTEDVIAGCEKADNLLLVLSDNDQMQQQLFGERIGAVSESDMQQFDDQIPEFAQRALRTAREQALAAGATVLEAINGELVETSPDGSRRFIKSLPAPYKVAPGAKRIRRINR
jgi:hypothetical protein